jgi:hypothetical protein
VNLTRQELADEAASLAVQGVYIGTSLWKYPGWCGMLYDRARYEYRGKFDENRFKREYLLEYAEVFKMVCVDAAPKLAPELAPSYLTRFAFRSWPSALTTTSLTSPLSSGENVI